MFSIFDSIVRRDCRANENPVSMGIKIRVAITNKFIKDNSDLIVEYYTIKTTFM